MDLGGRSTGDDGDSRSFDCACWEPGSERATGDGGSWSVGWHGEGVVGGQGASHPSSVRLLAAGHPLMPTPQRTRAPARRRWTGCRRRHGQALDGLAADGNTDRRWTGRLQTNTRTGAVQAADGHTDGRCEGCHPARPARPAAAHGGRPVASPPKTPAPATVDSTLGTLR